jgi:hypothetical protein
LPHCGLMLRDLAIDNFDTSAADEEPKKGDDADSSD